MPTLENLPRTARRRTAVTIGTVLLIIGAAFVPALLRNDTLMHPVVLLPVLLYAVGLPLVLWGRRGSDAAARADALQAARYGRWDGLPAGAYQDGARIGLTSQPVVGRAITVLGVLIVLAGVMVVLASQGADTEMLLGGCFILLLGGLMLFIRWIVGGTPYWLDAEGIRHNTWPGKPIRWVEVEAIQYAQRAIHLRRGTGLLAGSFRIAPGALEIDERSLMELLHALAGRAHRDAGLPPLDDPPGAGRTGPRPTER